MCYFISRLEYCISGQTSWTLFVNITRNDLFIYIFQLINHMCLLPKLPNCFHRNFTTFDEENWSLISIRTIIVTDTFRSSYSLYEKPEVIVSGFIHHIYSVILKDFRAAKLIFQLSSFEWYIFSYFKWLLNWKIFHQYIFVLTIL